MIKKIIALILVPIVFMLTGELTSIKDTVSVQFNIETNNTITTDTYNNLLTYKDFKDFTLKRSLNITNDDIDKSRLKINDGVKNEITNNELIENVSLIDLNNIEKISYNDKHFFPNFITSHNIKQLNQVYTDLNLLENVNTLNITSEKLADVTIYGKSSVKVKQSEIDIANKLNIPIYLENGQYLTKVKEKVIQDNNLLEMITTLINVDYTYISGFNDNLTWNNSINTNPIISDNMTQISYNNRDSVDSIGKFSTRADGLVLFYFAKGTTLAQAKTILIGKTLTYQLTTPRLALTEGIEDTINPKVKSTSPTNQTTEIQFNETLASIPNTSITDEIKPLANGQYEVTKKVKSLKLWEYSSISLSTTLANHYRFTLDNIVITNGIKANTSNNFINTFPFLSNFDSDTRHFYIGTSHLFIFIEKPLIDQQTGSTLTDKLKTYLQTNNITFKGELSTYEKYITTPTGNNLLELYPSGTVYTDSPIKLNYTDYTKPNSTINGNYSLFKNHLYYTGELQQGLFEINQTTKPVNTYEITNTTIKYDVITKKITLDINDSYNSIEISPNDTYKDLTGYELINNNYELTYYIYQIQDPYIREFIKIVPMIYIGVVLIYILMFKERN